MPNPRQQETLTTGDLELVILPDIGGRLWDVVFQGRSLLFQNSDLEGYTPDLSNLRDFPTRSPHFKFPLWGGEKTWIAPDTNWVEDAPYPVLDSGPYDITGKSPFHIALESAVCPLSGLQIEREIHLTGSSSWRIAHKVINRGLLDREVGIWSVMMLNHKARIGVPGRDLNATKVFGQPDGQITTAQSGLICECHKMQEYKVGIDTNESRVFLCLDHDDQPIWLRCVTQEANTGDTFAHDHALEVFNSGDYPYCEAEWHAPLKTLKPNAATEFCQHFSAWSETSPQKLEKTDLEFIKCMS